MDQHQPLIERVATEASVVMLVGGLDSGKTTLGEAMLFKTKATSRPGSVDDGTSVFDFEPEEVRRKTTISSSFHHCTWKKHEITLADTPGYSVL